MRLLITGATGLLGPYLCDACQPLGTVVRLGRQRGDLQCDLTQSADVQAMLAEVRPDVVIHAAGMTDVDGCERDPAAADALNHQAAAHLAAALPASARLIAIGTDQVYPGDALGAGSQGWAEGQEAPVNTYGASKLAGAQAIARHPRGLALHTNFFGPSRTEGRHSLSDFMLSRFRSGEAMTLFTDALFSPLHAQTLAELVAELIPLPLVGMVNAASRQGMSKRDFGHAIAAHAGLPTACASDGLSVAIPGRARRPLDLRMDGAKLHTALGRPLPTLREEIARL